MLSVIEPMTSTQTTDLSFMDSLRKGDFSRAVLRAALLVRDEGQQELFALARQRRTDFFPAEEVEARSVIEISNVCQQGCHYCSMAKGSGIKRYVMKPEAVIEMADFLYQRGRRVMLLQSGENQSKAWIEACTKIVSEMKNNHPDQELILCLGNLSEDQYVKLKKAGADRYILKFESSVKRLYEMWKPTDTMEERLHCLKMLVDIGFKTGSGNMVGMPGQTIDDIIDDLICMGEYDLTMNSCTVFIPGEACGYRDEPIGDVDYAFNMMALMRIMFPNRLMPTTSCLERCRPGGQEVGLMAGANTVTIHDGTPENYKNMFPIYSTKRFAPGNDHMLDAVARAKMTISTHPLQ